MSFFVKFIFLDSIPKRNNEVFIDLKAIAFIWPLCLIIKAQKFWSNINSNKQGKDNYENTGNRFIC